MSINMNKINDHSLPQSCVPLTPNLDQYKLHGGTRNKTKKKNTYPNIQPIQPIAGPIMSQKMPVTPTNLTNANNKEPSCQNHPQRKALYFSKENNPRLHFCGICAMTDGGGDSKFLDKQKHQKATTIDFFKKRVFTLKQSIAERQKQIQQLLQNQSNYFGECLNLLSSQFASIIQDIEQKHKELNNSLAEIIIKRKQTVDGNLNIMKEINKSLQRYLQDISQNYDEILQELPLEHFRDIMKQYNTKIQYYNENVFKKLAIKDEELKNNLNIFIPMQEFRRAIEKANIQYLGIFDGIASPKSLEKFTSTGNHSLAPNTSKGSRNIINERYERNNFDRKSQSKTATTTLQRKKINTNIHMIRGANKENLHMESYQNRDFRDQYYDS